MISTPLNETAVDSPVEAAPLYWVGIGASAGGLEAIKTLSAHLGELLSLVQGKSGVNFQEYKPATLHRRIERRIVARGLRNFDDYLALARISDEEVTTLYRDLIISVTRFFRDEKAYEALALQIEALVRGKSPHEPIRIWIAGCASGEEVYSIAILLAEALGGPEKLYYHHCQIFGSDIDEEALSYARRGVYPETVLKHLSPERRAQYFVRQGTSYEIIRPIREIALFTRHNMADDPPFLRMDLISCRNVLIYFSTELQERVLSTMHYGLILMDIQMQDVDGMRATRALRYIEQKTGRKRATVIAVTAHAQKGYREKCQQAGIDDYIAKPIYLEELEAKLLVHLTEAC